jgi:hypothetical protein
LKSSQELKASEISLKRKITITPNRKKTGFFRAYAAK